MLFDPLIAQEAGKTGEIKKELSGETCPWKTYCSLVTSFERYRIHNNMKGKKNYPAGHCKKAGQ